MAIPFLLFSILGAMVFAAARSNAVAILIIGVALGYATEIPTRFGVFRGQRLVGLWQVFTGIWLMYLTYGPYLISPWAGIGGPRKSSPRRTGQSP
jgi:hypothetical protein